MTTQNIITTARELRLSGISQCLDVRLQEATANQLSHAEFLDLVLQDELLVRRQRAFERRKKNAGFREHRTIVDFDFSFNPTISRSQIYELSTCHYLQSAKDILFIGPPGVGKSHLAQALGYQAVKQGHSVLYTSIFDLVRDLSVEEETAPGSRSRLNRYLKCELLIIDDMGIKQLPPRASEQLFEIVMRRHQLRSTIMTSNRPLEEWGKVIGDIPAATAILDRFMHHAEIIQITGQSYRIKDRLAAAVDTAEAPQVTETSVPGGELDAPTSS